MILNKVSFFFAGIIFLSSCASIEEQEKNTKIMNIWVAPEYASSSRLLDEQYIAVFINSSVPILTGEDIYKIIQ